jgi:hypothetical protein
MSTTSGDQLNSPEAVLTSETEYDRQLPTLYKLKNGTHIVVRTVKSCLGNSNGQVFLASLKNASAYNGENEFGTVLNSWLEQFTWQPEPEHLENMRYHTVDLAWEDIEWGAEDRIGWHVNCVDMKKSLFKPGKWITLPHVAAYRANETALHHTEERVLAPEKTVDALPVKGGTTLPQSPRPDSAKSIEPLPHVRLSCSPERENSHTCFRSRSVTARPLPNRNVLPHPIRVLPIPKKRGSRYVVACLEALSLSLP